MERDNEGWTLISAEQPGHDPTPATTPAQCSAVIILHVVSATCPAVAGMLARSYRLIDLIEDKIYEERVARHNLHTVGSVCSAAVRGNHAAARGPGTL